MTKTNTPTSASAAKAGRSRRTGTWIAVAGALLVLIVTFFVARHTGIEEGSQAARDRIEQENNLTAGPESLMKESH